MPGNPIVQRLMSLPPKQGGASCSFQRAARRSYDEVRDSMLGYAGWLSAEGVRPGERVAICLPKTVETVELIYGILAAGAAYVPLEYRGAPARLNGILASIRPALFVTTGPMAALLRQAGEPAPTGMRVIEIDEDTAALGRSVPRHSTGAARLPTYRPTSFQPSFSRRDRRAIPRGSCGRSAGLRPPWRIPCAGAGRGPTTVSSASPSFTTRRHARSSIP